MVENDAFSVSPFTAAAVILFLSLVYYFLKNRNILPGPRGLPYIGIYPFLKDDETCHLQLQEIGKKYGDLYSFTCVGNLFINLGSVKAIREVHVNKSECFAGRFTDFSFLTSCLKDGLVGANGEAWKVLRKYFVQSFKEYGLTFMKDNTAGPLYDTLAHTMDDIRSRKGKAFNVIDVLITRCMGTMRNVLFGVEGVSDSDLLKMNEAFAVMAEGILEKRSLMIGPLIRFLLFANPPLKRSIEHYKIMSDLLMKTIKNIERSVDENNPTCVVEDFFKERNMRKQKNDPSWRYFTDKALVDSLAQFVGDGILTVAYFIACFLQALAEHPEEQDKIYKELTDVVGSSRLPTIEDKSKLPYTVAFMNEVNRTYILFTMFASMQCTRETTVRGYRIPKGSITLLNFWQAHHDPQTYENPESFNPSRFLASPGKPREELPVSFGLGKRACTGEPFVMMKSFLFVTSIVKNFTISEPANSKRTSAASFISTGKLDICLKPRTEK